MSYSFRGNEDEKTMAVPKESNAAPAVKSSPAAKVESQAPPEPDPSNPFMDAPAAKVEERKAEPEMDVMDLIGKNNAQRPAKQQILASPNFVLTKKGVNKKTNKEAKNVLNKFGPAAGKSAPEEKAADCRETTTDPKPVLELSSANDNPVPAQKHNPSTSNKEVNSDQKIFKEERREMYSSPRAGGACCDSKYINSKVISCECTVL